MKKNLFKKILNFFKAKKIFLLISPIFFVVVFNFFYPKIFESNFFLKNIKKIKIFLNKKIFGEKIVQNINLYYYQNNDIIQLLLLVKDLVINNNFSCAEREIINLLKNNKKKELESLIYIQLAKIQFHNKNIVKSLHSLQEIKEDCWKIFSKHLQKNILSFQNGNIMDDFLCEEILLKYENIDN